MRKIGIAVLATLLSFLLAACSVETVKVGYPTDHTHVYGARYDVVPSTCVSTGTEVRYCKICHHPVTDPVGIPEEIETRRHAFSDVVVEPTEAAEGYTVRQCTLCEYVVDRAFVKPPKYALLQQDNTRTEAPDGVLAVLASDTKTHLLSHAVAGDTLITDELAVRLGVALAVMEELAREGTSLLQSTEIPMVSGTAAGATFTVRELLFAWIDEGNADVARAFAAYLDGGESAFAVRVSARLQKLGISAEIDPVAAGTATVTLHDTAVLVARAMDEPLLREAFSDAVGLAKVAGQTPVLYLSSADGSVRATAIPSGEGVWRFALLLGRPLPPQAESGVYLIT